MLEYTCWLHSHSWSRSFVWWGGGRLCCGEQLLFSCSDISMFFNDVGSWHLLSDKMIFLHKSYIHSLRVRVANPAPSQYELTALHIILGVPLSRHVKTPYIIPVAFTIWTCLDS